MSSQERRLWCLPALGHERSPGSGAQGLGCLAYWANCIRNLYRYLQGNDQISRMTGSIGLWLTGTFHIKSAGCSEFSQGAQLRVRVWVFPKRGDSQFGCFYFVSLETSEIGVASLKTFCFGVILKEAHEKPVLACLLSDSAYKFPLPVPSFCWAEVAWPQQVQPMPAPACGLVLVGVVHLHRSHCSQLGR